MSRLDPQVRVLLEAAESAGIPPLHEMSYAKARSFYLEASRAVAGEPPEQLDSQDTSAIHAGLQVPIRVYRPHGAQNGRLPCVIYYHGGGWCIGDLDSHDHVCRHLCQRSGYLVIAVNYRLGPEHPFPAAIEDAMAVLHWVAATDALPVDKSRVAVAGDSAGGNISAVVSLLARQEGGPRIRCQVLIYPATDMTMALPSHSRLAEGYRLTRSAIVWFINGYLRDGEDMQDLRASPLLAEDHSNLPPAFVLTAEFDPLVDEGHAYAQKLEQAGNSVDYRCYEGMVHGFVAMSGAVDRALEAIDDVVAYLRQQFET